MITLAQTSGEQAALLGFFLFIGVIAVLFLAAWVWAVVDAARWPNGSFKSGEKAMWVTLNAVGPFLASFLVWIVYLAVGRPDSATRAAIKGGYWQPPPKYASQPYYPQPGYPPQGGYQPPGGYPQQGGYQPPGSYQPPPSPPQPGPGESGWPPG